MNLTVENLLGGGPISYADALARQRELVRLRQRGEIDDTLLLLEHPPTVTFGKMTRPESLRLTPDGYRARGIALVETDRGGDATYHGPGQLVGYPIVSLGEGNRDVHRYVRRLEEVLLWAAADLGVEGADRAPWHAGIWVGDGYLAALGIRVTRWVTHHGFALNVTESVHDGFATIVPCGVAGKQIATVSSAADRATTVHEAARVVADRFREVFACASDSSNRKEKFYLTG